jgi:cytochrome c oxidase subunit I
VAVFVFNMVRSWRRVELTVSNPWRAQTLEWQVASPPPVENFDRIPTVSGTPYEYGSLGGVPTASATGQSTP